MDVKVLARTKSGGSDFFPETHWSVVIAAGSSDAEPTARAALAKLCETYWAPLYTFVRSRGYSVHDAQDLTQSFFAYLIEHKIYALVDQQKGWFRSFLLASIKNFLGHAYDRERTLKRGGAIEFLPLDEAQAEAAESLSATFLKACVARAFGDDAAARNAFSTARAEVERTVRERPDEGPPLCMLGLIDAGLGRKEEAIREGRRASALLPVTKDAINGAEIMQYLGLIYAWTGEKDLAINQLAATLQVPSLLSYGELRLHPFWDPLRGDPRFEKLVEEAKKPVALK